MAEKERDIHISMYTCGLTVLFEIVKGFANSFRLVTNLKFPFK